MDNPNINNQVPPAPPVQTPPPVVPVPLPAPVPPVAPVPQPTPVPPPVTPASPVPPVNGAAAAGAQLDAFTKNPKFIETIKTFVIYSALLNIALWLINVIQYSLLQTRYYPYKINFGHIVPTLFYGLIYGAIAGIVFYFAFNFIRDYIKASARASKYIYSIFTLFWAPSLWGNIAVAILAILPLLTVLFISGRMFLGIIISFVGNVFAYYIYSKIISSKLQALYPW